MHDSTLEDWAVSKAAQNRDIHPTWKPVVLYRNGEACGMGALLPTLGGMKLLTAGHLFWRGMAPCRWQYRILIPASHARLPLMDARAFGINPKADLAICTPGSILQTCRPLPNFYDQGGGYFVAPERVKVSANPERNAEIISTISGRTIVSVGETVYAGTPFEILDYATRSGESGTILWDKKIQK